LLLSNLKGFLKSTGITEQSVFIAATIKLGTSPNIARNTYAIAISLRGGRLSRRSKGWYLEESAQLSLLTIFSSPLMRLM
jgi:hypothetical protein